MPTKKRDLHRCIWRRLVPAEEVECSPPVLDRCEPGPDVRLILEPDKPGPIDLPGDLDCHLLGRNDIIGTGEKHDALFDPGKVIPGAVP